MQLHSGDTWTQVVDIVNPYNAPGSTLPDIPCLIIGASNQGTASNYGGTTGPLAFQVFKDGTDVTSLWSFTVTQPDATNYPWRYTITGVVPAYYDGSTVEIIGIVSFGSFSQVYAGELAILKIVVPETEALPVGQFGNPITLNTDGLTIDANISMISGLPPAVGFVVELSGGPYAGNRGVLTTIAPNDYTIRFEYHMATPPSSGDLFGLPLCDASVQANAALALIAAGLPALTGGATEPSVQATNLPTDYANSTDVANIRQEIANTILTELPQTIAVTTISLPHIPSFAILTRSQNYNGWQASIAGIGGGNYTLIVDVDNLGQSTWNLAFADSAPPHAIYSLRLTSTVAPFRNNLWTWISGRSGTGNIILTPGSDIQSIKTVPLTTTTAGTMPSTLIGTAPAGWLTADAFGAAPTGWITSSTFSADAINASVVDPALFIRLEGWPSALSNDVGEFDFIGFYSNLPVYGWNGGQEQIAYEPTYPAWCIFLGAPGPGGAWKVGSSNPTIVGLLSLGKDISQPVVQAPLSAADIAAAVWTDTTDFGTNGSAGKQLFAIPTTSGGGGLDAQQTRDAMTLTATNGDESIDAYLQGITNDTGTLVTDMATVIDDLQEIQAHTDLIAPGDINVIVTNPVAKSLTLTVVQGDDYDATTDQQITFTDGGTWPSLAGAEIRMTIADETLAVKTHSTCTVAGTPQVVTVPLTATQTAGLTPGVTYVYDVRAKLAGSNEIRTLISTSALNVIQPITTTW